MVNNELERKIVENVRNRIVVSNLEKEEQMKISKRKTIISLVAVMLIFVSGSFITVNAATDGQLAEGVKDFILVTFDEAKYKKTSENNGVDEQGNNYREYTLEAVDGTEEILVREMDPDENNVQYKLNEDGSLDMNVE